MISLIMGIGTLLWGRNVKGQLLYLPKEFNMLTRRLYGKITENVQEANRGEPSQTMVTINKAVLFCDFPQRICKA